ncbi:hypothetical protein RFI_30780 [Reticulomyxa filosa]|uniref:Uncharacterized protein n=1 Tax=Reticulomyxa filosa TaxID=46433 RepID=X6M0V4_RETFI|nr:hypothetical protein RFI_30780 [Reticulomyxa filosa]|eukprot:ETO06610.1 hypothetical protein RFI_30780 [Reticulomyxa filosa]
MFKNDALKCILSQFKEKDKNIIKLFGIVIEIIVIKLNKKQLYHVFKFLLKRFKFKELIERILMKLNKKRLNYIFKYLINELKDKKDCYCILYKIT